MISKRNRSSTATSSITSRDETCTIQRSFLLPTKSLQRLRGVGSFKKQDQEHYYDTKSHELSSAECILMKDSDSPKYWKFFCYATDNIMEITTDEQDIREPLARLLPYELPHDINKDLLTVSAFDRTLNTPQVFFTIENTECRTNIGNELMIDVVETDYGFAMCTIRTVHRVGHARALITLDDIDAVAAKIGAASLADYNPDVFL